MGRVIAALVFCILSFALYAHEDRILPINPDGTIAALPLEYGPVKVRISRSTNDPASLTGVVLSSPRFKVKLNSCVLGKLSNVTQIQASGSWYHDLRRMPPYVSLTFFNGPAKGTGSQFYAVTFSLIDGHILAGDRAWDPWWGAWRGQHIDPADKCSHWQNLGLWPNNSFKPKPLRGSA